MIDLTEETSPPPKRARLQQTPSSNEATVDVVVVSAASGAGPSGARAARNDDANPVPDGQDFQVLADTTRNPGRDLPHTREDCAVHAFTLGVSVGNAAACQRCYCAVCDKPAMECNAWGDGTLASNHCNLTRVDVGRAGRPAAAARVPSPAAGAYNSDSYDMDEDDMGGDPGGYGGPHGFGMFGRLYGDSYDSEEDPYGDRYGYGYDRYEDVCMGYHYAPGPPRKVNPWSFDNPESRQYWFKDAKGTVGKRVTAVPDPKDVLAAPKMTQYPINQAKLDELGLRIGSLSFPVKLTGVTFPALHAELEMAPFGYHMPGVGRLQDWRSWEGAFNKKHCLASIMLQQHFPATLPGGLKAAFDKNLEKDVTPPALPKRTVELLPFAPERTDPQPPPVAHVVRTVLFVDCIGDIPLRVYGVSVVEEQAMLSVKEALWQQVGAGEALASDEVLIIGSILSDNIAVPYKDNTTIRFHEEAHTYSDMAHVGTSGIHDPYTQNISRPMVCWRVRAVPKTFVTDGPSGFGDVHYVCVTTLAVTGGVAPYPEPVQLAGRVPVPVLIPVKDPSTAASKRGGAVFTGFNEKSAKAIAEKAAAIFSKWMTPEGKALLPQLEHLPRQLFCPLRTSQDKAGRVSGHPSPGDVRLRELGVCRFRTCNDTYRRPQVQPLHDRGGPDGGIINVQLLWDLIPPAPAQQGQVQLVSPDVQVERVAERLFDMATLMAPPADASAAPAVLKQHREYIKLRATVAQWQQDKQRQPRQILGALLENAVAPQAVTIVGGRLPAQRLFLKTTLSRRGASPQLDVTIWTHTLASQPMLSMLSTWTSVIAQSSRYHMEEREHPLRLALVRMLRANPELARMERELAAAPGGFALGTLLQKFEAAKDLPEAPQPAGFTAGIKLHDYQRQSLQWMLGAERTTLRDKLWVPLGHDDLWYSPVFGKLSEGVPAGPRGGILAEEMGLGKTVEVLALALANPAPATIVNGAAVKTPAGEFVQSRGTLVICKVSLVGQWVSEARSKLANQSLKVQEYHGGNRPRSVALLAGQDVVVTTYETLTSDMQGRSKRVKGDANPLARIKWWRVVLDESHAVKDLSSKALSAVRNVQSERRWACSGTPINTDVKDLSGQFAALHMEPLASLAFQGAYLKNGLTTSPRVIHFLLRSLMIRHSKAAVEASGAMRLPPKTEETVYVDFRQEEWQLYARTHAAARAEFDQFASVGASYCVTHTLSIMALLMPLRRLCSGGTFPATPAATTVRLKQHEHIVARAAQVGAAVAAAGDAAAADGSIPPATDQPLFPAGEELECSICMDGFEAPLRTPCKHWFCSECIQQVLQQRNSCPLCRHAPISRAHLRAAVFPEPTPEPEPEPEPEPKAEASTSAAGHDARRALAKVQMDSKINELVAQLTRMHAADKSNKALIFTQYNDTIRYLGDKLRAAGFAYRTISGSMPMKQRAAAIEAFQRDPPTTVFILSVRSGAVGINLTSANFIFMMEPLMNPALDEQAVGRAWRMGQKRPVTVKRLIMRGTLEDTIVTLAKGRKDAPPVAGNAKKLGSNQAGALRADKANLKFDEMRNLFAEPTIPAEVRARFEDAGE